VSRGDEVVAGSIQAATSDAVREVVPADSPCFELLITLADEADVFIFGRGQWSEQLQRDMAEAEQGRTFGFPIASHVMQWWGNTCTVNAKRAAIVSIVGSMIGKEAADDLAKRIAP
jgi:hypothetical protein